jgi:hypothetical protein
MDVSKSRSAVTFQFYQTEEDCLEFKSPDLHSGAARFEYQSRLGILRLRTFVVFFSSSR